MKALADSGSENLRTMTLTSKAKKAKENQKDLEAIFDEDPCQTKIQLATALNVTWQCISQQLHQIGMVQKRKLTTTRFDWKGHWTKKNNV